MPQGTVMFRFDELGGLCPMPQIGPNYVFDRDYFRLSLPKRDRVVAGRKAWTGGGSSGFTERRPDLAYGLEIDPGPGETLSKSARFREVVREAAVIRR